MIVTVVLMMLTMIVMGMANRTVLVLPMMVVGMVIVSVRNGVRLRVRVLVAHTGPGYLLPFGERGPSGALSGARLPIRRCETVRSSRAELQQGRRRPQLWWSIPARSAELREPELR